MCRSMCRKNIRDGNKKAPGALNAAGAFAPILGPFGGLAEGFMR